MKLRFFTTITLGFFALNVFSQYYSKVFLPESETGSFIYQSIPMDNETILFSHKAECDSILYCGGISTFNNIHGQNTFFDTHSKEFSNNNIKIFNDTVYTSFYNISPIANKCYWHFNTFLKNGDSITQVKFELPTPFDNRTINYGLELIKNNEIILWGNGYEPGIQNTIDSIKIVWLRIKKDGTLISGPHYWKPSDTHDFGIATDATTNVSGNMVFIRENFDWNIGIFRNIYVIDEFDKVHQITKVNAITRKYDFARLSVTSDDHLIMTTAEHDWARPMPKFYKLDYANDTVWTCTLPHLKSIYLGVGIPQDNLSETRINRIREARNGDILFCGTNAFIDSVYNHIHKRKIVMSNRGGGFFGRISPNGKLKWVHYMVSPKNTTGVNYITPQDINEMPNGDLILGGSIESSPDTLDYWKRAWLLRVNDKGCFDADCSHVDKWWYFPEQFPVGVDDLTQYNNDIMLAPNPFDISVTITLPIDIAYPVQYQIMTLSGQLATIGMINGSSHNTIETNHLLSGSYIFAIKDKKGKVFYQKGVKI